MDRWWEPPPETLNASNDAHLFVCQVRQMHRIEHSATFVPRGFWVLLAATSAKRPHSSTLHVAHSSRFVSAPASVGVAMHLKS